MSTMVSGKEPDVTCEKCGGAVPRDKAMRVKGKEYCLKCGPIMLFG